MKTSPITPGVFRAILLSLGLFLGARLPAVDFGQFASPSPEAVSQAITLLQAVMVSTPQDPSPQLLFANQYPTGSLRELRHAAALATLARALAADGENPPASVLDAYVGTVRAMITKSWHMPDLGGGLDSRQHAGAIFALAVGWNIPAVRAQFTADEQARILTMAEAAVVTAAYSYADYDAAGQFRGNQRTSLDGDANTWRGPNYAEGIMALFHAGAMIVGVDQVPALLDAYDHAAFKGELSTRHLNKIYAVWNHANSATNAQVEGILHAISGNDANGRPFYRGVRLADFVADPAVAIHLVDTRETYSNATITGDFTGTTGRLQEFSTYDSAGVRSSLSYSAMGLTNSLYTDYLVRFCPSSTDSYWQRSTDAAGKAEIEGRIKAGCSDLLMPARNGYFDRSQWVTTREKSFVCLAIGRPDAWQSPASAAYPDTGWFDYARDMGESMRYFRHIFASANFEDQQAPAALQGWDLVDGAATFNIRAQSAWNGNPSYTESVAASSGTGLVRAVFLGFEDLNCYAHVAVRPSSFGTPGRLGVMIRYYDSDNATLFRYDHSQGRIAIVRRLNGVETVLASRAYTMDPGTIYWIRARYHNTLLQIGVHTGTAAESRISTSEAGLALPGRVGIFTEGASAQFNDLLITDSY